MKVQARSKAEITEGVEQIALVKVSPPPHPTSQKIVHKAYKNSCQIDTNAVHNGTCRFRQKAKKLLLLCFFADKVVGNIHQIHSISFKNVFLKLRGLLKFKQFDS